MSDYYIGLKLTNTTTQTDYLVLDMPNSATFTVRDWSWVMDVISWNPCNNLMDFYGVQCARAKGYE